MRFLKSGFVIKLVSEDGRSAWIGLAFHDRNAAFDFYAKVCEYFEKKEKVHKEYKVDPNVDFSLGSSKNLFF